ncbi:MAG: Ig-like domain-containing protein, partial [Pseudohongiellaceae bacterium]
GAGSVKLSVATEDDETDEPNGRITVTLGADAGNYDLGAAVSAGVEVRDDDDDMTPPTVGISGAARLEFGEAATISFALSEASTNFAQADITVSPAGLGTLSGFTGSGTAYTATFTAGSSLGSVVISVGAGAFTDAAGNGNPAASHNIEIVAPTPSLSIASAVAGNSVAEGQPAVFIITAAPAPMGVLNVNLSLAQEGDFISAFPRPATIDFARGEETATLSVPTVDDEVGEADGSVTVTLATGTGYTVGAPGSAMIAITDDDLDISAATAQATEVVLPHVAATIATEGMIAIEGRMDNLFNGAPAGASASGLQIRGNSVAQFIAGLARKEDQQGDGAWQNLNLLAGDFAFNISLSPDNAGGASPPSANHSLAILNADAGSNAGGASPPSASHNLAILNAAAGNAAAGSADNREITVWGRGYHRDLNASEAGKTNFDGDVQGALIGIDRRTSNMVLGLAASRANAEMRYDSGLVTGTHETSVVSLHPYIGLQLDNDSHIWGTLGLGQGEIEATADGFTDIYTRDVSMQSISFGGYSPLMQSGDAANTTRIGIVGDGLYSRMQEDDQAGASASAGAGASSPVETDLGRVRLGIKLGKEYTGDNGGAFAGSLELTYRHEFSTDAPNGSGLELGGTADLALSSGLRLDITARTLLINDDFRDWGVSGGIAWTRSPTGRGLSLSLRPQWGTTASQAATLWQDAAVDYSAFSTPTPEPSLGYALELNYGIPLRLQRNETLLNLSARNQTHPTGQTFTLGADIDLNQYLTLGYQTIIQQALTPPPNTPGTNTPTTNAPGTAPRTNIGTSLGTNPGTSLTLPGTTPGAPHNYPGNPANHSFYIRYERPL